MILLGNPCSFYILSLNNLASPFADVFSVVGIKYTTFVNLSTTTKIELYSWARGSLVMKSANIWAQDFSRIEFDISFPASERGKRGFYCDKQKQVVVTVLNRVLKGLWGEEESKGIRKKLKSEYIAYLESKYRRNDGDSI